VASLPDHEDKTIQFNTYVNKDTQYTIKLKKTARPATPGRPPGGGGAARPPPPPGAAPPPPPRPQHRREQYPAPPGAGQDQPVVATGRGCGSAHHMVRTIIMSPGDLPCFFRNENHHGGRPPDRPAGRGARGPACRARHPSATVRQPLPGRR
jgi:hypothetical protein